MNLIIAPVQARQGWRQIDKAREGLDYGNSASLIQKK